MLSARVWVPGEDFGIGLRGAGSYPILAQDTGMIQFTFFRKLACGTVGQAAGVPPSWWLLQESRAENGSETGEKGC